MRKIGIALLLCVMAYAVSADGDHAGEPPLDNMCDHDGRDCNNEAEWVAGYYAFIAHINGYTLNKSPWLQQSNRYTGDSAVPDDEGDRWWCGFVKLTSHYCEVWRAAHCMERHMKAEDNLGIVPLAEHCP